MNGNFIAIYANSHLIGGTKGNDVQTGAETIECSGPTSGNWREYVAGRKEWGMTTSYIVLNSTVVGTQNGSALNISGGSNIQDLLQVGNEFTLEFRTKQNAFATLGVTGTAILTEAKISATVEHLVTGFFKFVGSGPLAPIEATPSQSSS